MPYFSQYDTEHICFFNSEIVTCLPPLQNTHKKPIQEKDYYRQIPQCSSKWIKGREPEIIIARHSVERSKVEYFCTCQWLCSVYVRVGWHSKGNGTTPPTLKGRMMSMNWFFNSYSGASCIRSSAWYKLQTAMYGNEVDLLLVEAMLWSVSSRECGVLHREHIILRVQWVR